MGKDDEGGRLFIEKRARFQLRHNTRRFLRCSSDSLLSFEVTSRTCELGVREADGSKGPCQTRAKTCIQSDLTVEAAPNLLLLQI